MKKSMRIFVCAIMIICMLASAVGFAAEDHVIANPIDTDATVSVQMKVQGEKDIAYAIRSAYGDSKTQDIIQYMSKSVGLDGYKMEGNPSFDPASYKQVVEKSSSNENLFGSTISGGDERTPISVAGMVGWIGAGHGGTIGMVVNAPDHGLSYGSIGRVYEDRKTLVSGKYKPWTLLGIVDKDNLIMLPSSYKEQGTNGNPGFGSGIADKDAETGDSVLKYGEEKLLVKKVTTSLQFRPAFTMDKQEVYVVNDGTKSYVTEAGKNYTGEYVCFEEEYTVKNPATVAAAIAENVGKYTENPNLAVGDDYMTFKLNYKYYSDGTCLSDWELTFHADTKIHMYGGIQYDAKKSSGDLFIYLPNTKEFTYNNTQYNYAKPQSGAMVMMRPAESKEKVTFTPVSTSAVYGTYRDDNYTPNRRLDLSGKINETKNLYQVFAGGFLPIDDGANEIRNNNTYGAYFLYSSKKAYFHFIDEQFYENHKNEENTIIGKTIKGTAYKKYANAFGDDFSYSYYTVPFERGAKKQLYIYIDIFNSNTTKTFDISALEDYEIEKLEEINLAATDGWKIEESTLSVTSGDTTNESSSLVLCATYKKGIEDRIAALSDTYTSKNATEIAEIDADIKEIGLAENKYSNIAKFNTIKTSMVAGLTNEKLSTATAEDIEEIEAMIKVGADVDKNSDEYKIYEALKKEQPITCEITFSNGDNVYLNNKITNPGYREDGKHTILLAFYDDTKLIDVKTIEKEETRAEKEYVDTYAEDWPLGAESVRVFVWDNVNNIVPFGRAAAKER